MLGLYTTWNVPFLSSLCSIQWRVGTIKNRSMLIQSSHCGFLQLPVVIINTATNLISRPTAVWHISIFPKFLSDWQGHVSPLYLYKGNVCDLLWVTCSARLLKNSCGASNIELKCILITTLHAWPQYSLTSKLHQATVPTERLRPQFHKMLLTFLRSYVEQLLTNMWPWLLYGISFKSNLLETSRSGLFDY